MGMFTNYKNIPNRYIPNNQCQRKPDLTAERLPYELYDPQGKFIGYCWHYGDSIDLQFVISGDVVYSDKDYYVDAPTFLKTIVKQPEQQSVEQDGVEQSVEQSVKQTVRQIRLQIRDFRQEVVYEYITGDFTTLDEMSVVITFPINYCKSSRLVRGRYTYNLILETVYYVNEKGEYVDIEDVTEDSIRVVEDTHTIQSDCSIILIK